STLDYSTYLGGGGSDSGNGIAVDSSEDAYVTGTTQSGDFPTVNFFDDSLAGAEDAFVSKFDPSLSGVASLLYSTYLGGGDSDSGNGIAVDSTGNAYVTGTTRSGDFPTQSPFQAAKSGSNDAFVTKFNAAGSALTYSTYLGGSGNDFGNSIAVDISANAYVTGTTESANFPIANAFQSNLIGTRDSFVTKVNSAGDTLAYSSYLGGSNDDFGNSIAVDGLGNAFVAGTTDSTNFPTKSVQDTPGGGDDGFVAKVQEAEVTEGAGGGNESSGGGGGGGCFIATAAEGSPMAWPGQLLSVIFILFALLSITLSVLFRRLKLREVVSKTARLKSK
ncbi:MAG: SBBP repeat-containing protein, partial [Syntrophobacterales bacterium]